MAGRLGTTSFLGDYGIIAGLHDADNLPSHILDENPSLLTLSRVLNEVPELSVVFLSTSMRYNPTVVERQNRASEMLREAGASVEVIDGSDPGNKKRRDALFKLSGRRGVYPQFFIFDPNDYEDKETIKYIGDWELFEHMNDVDGLPDYVADSQSNFKTWKSLLGRHRVVEGVGSGK